MRQTLIETQLFELSPRSLTEAKTSERGNLLVSGRLQAAQTKNGNGRYYPREILEREVKNYKEGPIKENRALGELDHPDSSVINLKNVSHNIKEIYFDGDDVMGVVEILPTPSGNILTELFKNGMKRWASIVTFVSLFFNVPASNEVGVTFGPKEALSEFFTLY